jgi:environmental stress-induced protein Ves
MQVVRAADYRRMKWRNGGGETAEVAISPPGSLLDAFDWRISMARVETDGPFSAFAGVDRSLAIVDGAGLRLQITGRAPLELSTSSAPCVFPADVPTTATLIAGAITDLNVMTRRDRCKHRLRREELPASRLLQLDAPVTYVVCGGGRVRASRDGQTLVIDAHDALDCRGSGAAITLAPEGVATVFVVELTPS